MKKCWTTLKEAQERSYGKVKWWNCEGANGETVLDEGDVAACPVMVYESSGMYVGKCNHAYERHGFGVWYFHDGRMLVGNWIEGKLSGPGKRVWLPLSPTWAENRFAHSPIQMRGQTKLGFPYIYIGNYTRGLKEDPRATVILKDGTTRIGQWKNDKPVGDWWEDHETSVTSPEELSKLLSFGIHEQSTAFLSSINLKQSKSEDPLHDFHKPPPRDDDCSEISWSVIAEQKSSSDPDFAPPNESTTNSTTVKQSNHGDPSTSPRGRTSPKSVTFVEGTKTAVTKKFSPSKGAVYKYRGHSSEDEEGIEVAAFAPSQQAVTTETLIQHVVPDDTPMQPTVASPVGTPMQPKEPLDTLAHYKPAVPMLANHPQEQPRQSTRMYDHHQREQIASLAEWLREDVIGYNANATEMVFYAENLLDYGFHSVDMIQAFGIPEDVETFHWMKVIHRRVFLTRAQLKGKAAGG
jgi:hypothetical protein